MIQSRYYLTIILLLLLTSCIHNSKESQSLNPYKIQYIELADTLNYNENGSFVYYFKIPIFDDDNLRFINKYILEVVAKQLEIEKISNNIASLDKEKLNSYIITYSKQLELDNSDTDLIQFEFSKSLNIDTIFTLKKLIVLEENNESYTGGAHGAYSTNFSVFDLINKKILKASDIFEINELTEIAYEYFLKERGLTKNRESVEKEGYWFKDNKFHLNDNFSFDNKNITFLYNPYEIASYAEGQILIEIPLDKLESIIKKEYKYIIN
jgi:hypothetical protein